MEPEQGMLLAHSGTDKLAREELKLVPTPEGTDTYSSSPCWDLR